MLAIFQEGSIEGVASFVGARVLRRKLNSGMMGGIKKVDNLVGKIGGNNPQQQMPPAVPGPPASQPNPQQNQQQNQQPQIQPLGQIK